MARKACIALLAVAVCLCIVGVAVAEELEYDEYGYPMQPEPEGNYYEEDVCHDCNWDYKKLILSCYCDKPCKKIKATINNSPWGVDKKGNVAYPHDEEYPDEDEVCPVYRYVSLKKCKSGCVYWNDKRYTLTCWRNPPAEACNPYTYIWKEPAKTPKNWGPGKTVHKITKDDYYKPKSTYKD